ncbi:MAG TPA: efflux RND transporter periplasmic adaptor subunit, partial [Gemmatimonadaceae bacterium]
MKRFLGAALLVAAAACAKKVQAPTVQTAVVTRRDIIIDAQANGVIEPIAIIEVKSKASGVITRMPVETGTHVNPGDLIVQIDTRDVQNRYDQMKAALDAAEARLSLAESDRKRNEELYKARVITPQEFENSSVTYETAKSNIITARTNLDLAKQALEEATVKAPAIGTIIDKTVSEGTVVAGATSSVSGGTTIVKMADLTTVRVRALFNESDIGNIHSGQPANVTVDAYPDRRFAGVVEKIEPQAVVQQNVTMFPVLVNLDNAERLLKPGMNGTINVLIDEHDGVIAVPNDAIKNPREAVATGAMLGLSADTITKELTAQGFNATGNRGGFGPGGGAAGRRGGNRNGGGGGNGGGGNGAAASAANGGTSGSAAGDLALGQQGQQGGFGGQQVSDEECKKIDDILKAHPKEKKQLGDLVAKMTALRPAGFGGGNGRGGNGGNRRGEQ